MKRGNILYLTGLPRLENNLMSTLMAVRLSNYADTFCLHHWQGTEMW